MINTAEFRKKTIEELKAELESVEGDFRKIISEVSQKKEKNVRKIRVTQKDIARIKTLITEKLKEIKGN